MKNKMLTPALCLAGALIAATGATAALASTDSPGPTVLTATEVEQQLATAPTAAVGANTQSKAAGRVTAVGSQAVLATVTCRAGKMTNLRVVPRPGWKRVGQMERTSLKVFGAQRSAVLMTHVQRTIREQFAVYCVNDGAWSAWRAPDGQYMIPETTVNDMKRLGLLKADPTR